MQSEGKCPNCGKHVQAVEGEAGWLWQGSASCPECQVRLLVCQEPGCPDYALGGYVWDDPWCPQHLPKTDPEADGAADSHADERSPITVRTPTKPEGKCPNCGKHVQAVVGEEGWIGRDSCRCPKCHARLLVCLMPGCDDYVLGGDVWDDKLCPQHSPETVLIGDFADTHRNKEGSSTTATTFAAAGTTLGSPLVGMVGYVLGKYTYEAGKTYVRNRIVQPAVRKAIVNSTAIAFLQFLVCLGCLAGFYFGENYLVVKLAVSASILAMIAYNVLHLVFEVIPEAFRLSKRLNGYEGAILRFLEISLVKEIFVVRAVFLLLFLWLLVWLSRTSLVLCQD